MQNKFIYLDQTKDQLPLMGTDLYYIRAHSILNTSTNRNQILNNLDRDTRLDLLFGLHFLWPAYPRFDRESYLYKVGYNPAYQFLPNLQERRKLDFVDLTDARALELEKLAVRYKNVFLFWSGGVDSTCILSAILKNWKKESLKHLVVILNKYSIEENKFMYDNFIHDKISTVSTDLFFSGEINFSNDNLYLDGECAASIFVTLCYEFEKRFPGYSLKPWKDNTDVLIKFFGIYEDTVYGEHMYNIVVESLKKNRLEVETIFDFIWWMGFNWNHDKNLHHILWQYHPCFFANPSIDLKRFINENVFHFFNAADFQDWRVSAIGTDLLVGSTMKEHKLSFKKYIFDFNKDKDFLDYKGKEASTPKNPIKNNHVILCAIDTDYNYYYRYTHEKIWPPK